MPPMPAAISKTTPDQIKSVDVRKPGLLIITLKTGEVYKYDITDPKEKADFESKFGELSPKPAASPAPATAPSPAVAPAPVAAPTPVKYKVVATVNVKDISTSDAGPATKLP